MLRVVRVLTLAELPHVFLYTDDSEDFAGSLLRELELDLWSCFRTAADPGKSQKSKRFFKAVVIQERFEGLRLTRLLSVGQYLQA